MSSTPLVACSFAFPSAAATRPSTTIGLCQCALPIGSSPTRRPDVGTVDADAAAPLRRRAARLRRPGSCRRCRSTRPRAGVPPRSRQAAVPPRVATKTQLPLPGRGRGEEIGPAGHRHRLQLAAGVAFTPARRES